MLFSPQKKLSSAFFLQLIGLISVIHVSVLLVLFVAEHWRAGASIVLGMSGGARVRMLPGKGVGGKGGAFAPHSTPAHAAPSQAAFQAPSQEKRSAQPVSAPQASEKKEIPAVKKSEPKELAPQTPKKETKEKPTPKEPAVPSFSPLKKAKKATSDYSPLTKPEPVKKDLVSEKAASQAQEGYSALPKKVDQKLEPKGPAVNSEAVHSPAASQATAKSPSAPLENSSGQHSGMVEAAGHHDSGGVAGGYGYGSGTSETVDIHGEEPGWSYNEYSREFFAHYVPPPGFKDNDPFSITFDIIEGKAANISARGSEPLALYAAAKSAILKMKFARTKFVKRITFII